MIILLIAKIVGLIIIGSIFLFLYGCNSKHPEPTPEPDPEPEPTPEDDWKEHYPKGYKIPIFDINKNKWGDRIFDSSKWKQYENRINEFMDKENRVEYDDYSLAKVMTHKENGEYFFVWTDDMVTWDKRDYWATPAQFVIDKLGLGDCDDMAGLHCDYLYRLGYMPIVFWLEIYWKRRVLNTLNNTYYWKDLGHAVTIYKRTPKDNWRCFSNQQWLGMSNGVPEIKDIVYKFVPVNNPSFKDDYELTKIYGRHPVTGKLLFEWRS